MHGGAAGSGAPRGNTNALKHGAYTRETIKRNKEIREFTRTLREQLKKLKGALIPPS